MIGLIWYPTRRRQPVFQSRVGVRGCNPEGGNDVRQGEESPAKQDQEGRRRHAVSAYPWMKRHKRYLSFRYIFPEIAAVWITFKRFVLRLVWFFTHPVDEFLDDIRDATAVAVCGP